MLVLVHKVGDYALGNNAIGVEDASKNHSEKGLRDTCLCCCKPLAPDGSVVPHPLQGLVSLTTST